MLSAHPVPPFCTSEHTLRSPKAQGIPGLGRIGAPAQVFMMGGHRNFRAFEHRSDTKEPRMSGQRVAISTPARAGPPAAARKRSRAGGILPLVYRRARHAGDWPAGVPRFHETMNRFCQGVGVVDPTRTLQCATARD